MCTCPGKDKCFIVLFNLGDVFSRDSKSGGSSFTFMIRMNDGMKSSPTFVFECRTRTLNFKMSVLIDSVIMDIAIGPSLYFSRIVQEKLDFHG